MEFLLGADPEVFAKKSGKIISAHGLVEGSKMYPHPVENGAVQVDGMALEFNIDPAENEEAFLYNIQHVMSQLRELSGCELVADPVAHFTEEYMSQQPLEAVEMGCDADYNAWTGKENPRPDQDRPMRTGAGHVHFGWTAEASGEAHLGMCTELVKQSDFYLGLPSLLFDAEVERRELYGKAGAYRPKSYGAEYRVLSNRWLSDESLIRWVYKASAACIQSMMSGLLVDKYGDIQEIINTSDVDAALSIIKAEGILIPTGV